MSALPLYISLTFGITTFVTLAIFHYALVQASNPRTAAIVTGTLLLWIIIQSVLAVNGFYRQHLDQLPPRFALIIAPTFLLILVAFTWKKGRDFIDQLPLAPLTYLSTVRIAVELVLYWLFLHQTLPELMTFAGRNFDILAGITAPLVAYYGLQRSMLSRNVIIGWNVVALGLLLFIVVNAILSAPTPLQQLAFDQPNVAIFYFPFLLLPAVVVPLVLFSHLVSLRQLLWLNRPFPTVAVP